jgi:hypothetical protein
MTEKSKIYEFINKDKFCQNKSPYRIKVFRIGNKPLCLMRLISLLPGRKV